MSVIPIFTAVRIIPRDEEFLDRKLGSRGEIYFDQTNNTLRLYDADVQGGVSLAKSDLSNISNSDFAAKATSAGVGSGSPGDNDATSVTVGSTLPEDPENGNLWLNTNNGFLYVYINDGDTSQWIQPAVPASSGSYDDLTDKPSIPTNTSDLTNDSGFLISIPTTISSDIVGEDSTLLIDSQSSKIVGPLEVTNPIITGAITSSDSSAITFIPAVDFNSDLNVQNELTVSSKITTSSLITTSLTASGIVTFNGTVLGLTASDVSLGNVTNESKSTMFTTPTFTGTTTANNLTINGITTIGQSVEKMTTKTGITSVTEFDFDQGTVWFLYDIDTNFTANFSNIPSSIESTISIALIINQSATAYLPNAVQINGASQNLKWQDGSEPVPNAESTDIVSFTLIYTGSTWEVLGSLTTYA